MKILTYFYSIFIPILFSSVKSENKQGVTFCTPIGPCEFGKCCRTLANGLFGNIGTCIDLPLEGEQCDINCPCSMGFQCAKNPLCLKCNPICMKNSVIKKLNYYLNNACFGNCSGSLFNHLFHPAGSSQCSVFRKESESCNEECKCVVGSYCAPNILCKQCDDICMSGEVVDSMIHYFNVGCLKNCAGIVSKYSRMLAINFDPNKLRFDSKGTVLFPELN